jgi:hypothetical protein
LTQLPERAQGPSAPQINEPQINDLAAALGKRLRGEVRFDDRVP